ncbi:MAG: hypothetical protein KAZ87_08875 [Spirochaetes bacterium]|nr:hypothetical protein [Spirochaetota bacterium]
MKTYKVIVLVIFVISCKTYNSNAFIDLEEVRKHESAGISFNAVLKKKGICTQENCFPLSELTDSDLCEIWNNLDFLEKTVRLNLENRLTTKTSNGLPYRRKKIILFENKLIIAEDISTEFKAVYDPAHPDSFKSGKQKGFVLYPNVDRLKEEIELSVILKYKKLINKKLNDR